MKYSITTLLCMTAVCAILCRLWMGTKPPSLEDWGFRAPPIGHPQGIDEEYAFHHFYGKSLAEAEAMFVDNAMYYQEDLLWMPDICMQFYIIAYCDYLLSDVSADDSDAASCFFMIAELNHEAIAAGGKELIDKVSEVLQRLAAQQAWYGASKEIYGDFEKHAIKCLNLIESAG